MSKLGQAVKSMETTRGQTDPVRELRHWRLQAEKRFLGAVVKASRPAAPKGTVGK